MSIVFDKSDESSEKTSATVCDPRYCGGKVVELENEQHSRVADLTIYVFCVQTICTVVH